jgi:4-hydroxybenzoyl-CoA reductase subunit alpha
MGLGEVLYESLPLTRRNGLLKSASLLDYKLPTALDTPEIEVHIVESMDPEGPLGAKEAGEGPLLGVAAAVANAIYDAVGIRLTSVPFTSESILAALHAQRHSPAEALA